MDIPSGSNTNTNTKDSATQNPTSTSTDVIPDGGTMKETADVPALADVADKDQSHNQVHQPVSHHRMIMRPESAAADYLRDHYPDFLECCPYQGCIFSVSCGPYNGVPKTCYKHRKNTWTLLYDTEGYRRCHHPGCLHRKAKIASFGWENELYRYCHRHAQPGMISLHLRIKATTQSIAQAETKYQHEELEKLIAKTSPKAASSSVKRKASAEPSPRNKIKQARTAQLRQQIDDDDDDNLLSTLPMAVPQLNRYSEVDPNAHRRASIPAWITTQVGIY